MGAEIAAAQSRGDGRLRRGQQGVGPRPARALLLGLGRGADADRGAAADARRHEPRDQRRAARARHRPGLRRRPFGRRVLGARRRRLDRASARRSALVRERGLAMAAAAKERPGSMAAILGLADEVVEGLCRKIHNVWPANYNCPGQLVISGETDAVDEACSEAQHAGARRAIRLQGLGRVPLAVRRERRRAPAPGDRQDRLQGADGAVRLDRDREARGRRPLPLAARRAAHGAGAASRRPRASWSATASRRSSRSGPATCSAVY